MAISPCQRCGALFESKRRRYCPPCGRNSPTKRCPNHPDRPVRARGLCSTCYNDERYPDQRRAWPDNPEAKRKRDLISHKRRRAATRGVDAEAIDRDVVGDRDRWRCGICFRRVNRLLPYPHPMSPSLDHVIPLAEGGPHTYANVRISHLRCNLRRQDRGGNEQLALIG